MTTIFFFDECKTARWANIAVYHCKLCKRPSDGGDYFVTPRGLFSLSASGAEHAITSYLGLVLKLFLSMNASRKAKEGE